MSCGFESLRENGLNFDVGGSDTGFVNFGNEWPGPTTVLGPDTANVLEGPADPSLDRSTDGSAQQSPQQDSAASEDPYYG